mmetsp:Transcript_109008/g.307239  ORF Transcript_109008/g.307239 Transcript_109008/m.307239 type:complete len:124 (-) Transcript_109008:251-622(-)
MATVRVEPKVWFSAERTFLHWGKISMVFATIASGLAMQFHNGAAFTDAVCAIVMGVAAFFVLIYAYRRHVRRTCALATGGQSAISTQDFADTKGAVLLAGLLTVAVLAMLGSSSSFFQPSPSA